MKKIFLATLLAVFSCAAFAQGGYQGIPAAGSTPYNGFTNNNTFIPGGLDCTGNNDATNALTAASSSMSYIVIPSNCTLKIVAGSVPIASNQTWIINGTITKPAVNSVTVFSAQSVNDWAVYGPGVISGSGPFVSGGNDVAFAIFNCRRWRVERMKIMNFGYSTGGALIVTSNALGATYGDRGLVIGNTLIANNFGVDLEGNVEYTLVQGNDIVGSGTFGTGVQVKGGNNNIIDNNITDNYQGIYLVPTGNGTHGIVADNNINHNTNYNVYVQGTTAGLGETFTNNHIYSTGTTDGYVYLQSAQGNLFVGNTINAPIKFATLTGRNTFSNNYVGTTNLVFTDDGTGVTDVMWVDNYPDSVGIPFASLPSVVAPGSRLFCSDCKNFVTNAVTVGTLASGSGGGAYVVRQGTTGTNWYTMD